MKYYLEKTDAVFRELNSGAGGLTTEEAAKRTQNGKNALAAAKKTPLLIRFLSQLADPMIIILLAAAAVSGVVAYFSGESYADVIIILFVVIVNAVLGVVQESKAESAIDALQKMSAPTAKVLRDGKVTQIKTEDIVVGDVVVLDAGDSVPADGRIIECASLKIEEAALTGESVPSDKTAEELYGDEIPLGDRKNMAYSGSNVVYGRAHMLVTAIGMDTEVGKIAGALSGVEKQKTPLQRKLGQLSKVLSYAVIGICAFIFAFKLIITGDISAAVVIDTFMVAVSLAVAAVPEGLATVVTIVLSIGVTSMAKRNAIIRKLTAVETLGSAQIICSDKTGTLTQNKMTVVDHYGADEAELAKAMALCTDVVPDEDGNMVGEPTQCAMIGFGAGMGIYKNDLSAKTPRIGEAPFDSERKLMSTLHRLESGRVVQYTTGAADELLRRCTAILDKNGVRPLTDDDRRAIGAANYAMADKALRVIAAAEVEYDELPANLAPDAIEKNLVFVGLVGMIDPVRPEVVDAIKRCSDAGIRPIMITGDHKNTAIAIAKQLGILEDASQAMTGAELDQIPDDEYFEKCEHYSVYARVKPENKTRIVQTWQKKGYICAMTGDGVNDSPSIKAADIGVGMGITGTDVTKNVADMVLADDNFATIVNAVAEGRKIYDNIRKAIGFLLSSNLSEVVGIFISTLMGFTLLRPVHLLWINLITDTFPALGLGVESGDENAMRRPPRPASESLFARGLGVNVVWQGVMIAGLTLFSYFVGHRIESGTWEIAQSADGITMAFLTMSLAEMFHSFNMRSEKSSVFTLKKQNIYLWSALGTAFVLTLLVIYVPFLAHAFQFETVSLAEFGISVAIAFLVIPITEIVKAFSRLADKKKK